MILRSPGETLEGSDLLDEVAGGLGVLLWRAFRSAALWTSVGPRERRRLFAPGARDRWLRDGASVPTPAALHDPLRAFASLLAPASAGTAERVARACTEISEWAVETGSPLTALAFAQAAAAASPESAPAALATALRAEAVGQEIRAESWLRRALALSRARQDRTTRAHAFVHLARILARRGEEVRAARMYARALRLAGSSGPEAVRAEALREMDGLAARGAAAARKRRTAGE